MKVKYIGDHVKTDSIPGLGLRWEPGQRRDVTGAVAERLLCYRDTWVKAGNETATEDTNEPIGFMEGDKFDNDPIPVVNFHAMDKDTLLRYAADKWSEKFPKNISEGVLRERVIKLHTKHEMER